MSAIGAPVGLMSASRRSLRVWLSRRLARVFGSLFDSALATSLALTGVAALRRAAWLDRAAVATATLLAADAWFDVVTSRGALAVAFATTEALAVEIPVALLCLWIARSVATTNPKGALQ